jgi:hypothetical protein
MRIPLPTDLKTRTGAPDKDARQKNSYVETKGEGAIVRKRPSAQGGIPIGTGVAQGGIGLNINGTPYFIGFWADTMQPYTGGGTSWNAAVSYLMGDYASVDFEDYWAIDTNPSSLNQNDPPQSDIRSPSNPNGKWVKYPTGKPYSVNSYYRALYNEIWYGDTPLYCPYVGGCVYTHYIYRNLSQAKSVTEGVDGLIGSPPVANWIWDGTLDQYSGYGFYPPSVSGSWHAPV